MGSRSYIGPATDTGIGQFLEESSTATRRDWKLILCDFTEHNKVYTIRHSLFKMAYMSDVVTINPMDKVERPQSPARYMQKFSKKYDVPNLHPHKLRHTFASIAITNRADVASVSEKLGHSDKAVTLRMYTHADQESMKRASQIFRNTLKKAGQE